MVVNGVKQAGCDIHNPYRAGGSAMTYSEPTPGKPCGIEPPPSPWMRKVRHKPSGVVYDSAKQAADALGYAEKTVRCQCAPSQQGNGVFEWAEKEKKSHRL